MYLMALRIVSIKNVTNKYETYSIAWIIGSLAQYLLKPSNSVAEIFFKTLSVCLSTYIGHILVSFKCLWFYLRWIKAFFGWMIRCDRNITHQMSNSEILKQYCFIFKNSLLKWFTTLLLWFVWMLKNLIFPFN